MKNYVINRTSTNSLSKNSVALLIILSMLFQFYYPLLAFADTESATTTTEQTETGDATSGVIVENEMNTNTLDSSAETENSDQANASSTDEEDLDESSTSTEDELESNTDTENSSTTTEKSLEESKDLSTSSSTEATGSSTETTVATSTTNGTSTENTTGSSTSTATTTESHDGSDDEFLENSSSTIDELASTTEENVSGDIAIISTNTATSSTQASSSALTGNNSTETEMGNFETNTGDAVAYVDLVNVLNTNIVNSTGLIEFIRDVLGYEDFDLRDMFSDIFGGVNTAESTASCAEDVCNLSQMIKLYNEATIENDVTVIADTGSNNGSGENGEINTGDAYASANIANLANSNIVDSNYLLLTFSNFSDLAGSLVLPNSEFFTSLMQNGQTNTGDFNFSNTANMNNTVTTTAETGGNQATGTENSIQTGDATSNTFVSNTVNQNLLNTNSFSMLIRVHGDWSGDVFGLPEGMLWEDTGEGIRLYYDNGSNAGTSTENTVNITNDATINNNVKVFALTGDNAVDSTNKAEINTGNAHADTTIFNIANTNVIGSNWINLIFNIYGNWSGNISFGQPDLWIGLTSASESNNLRPGHDITYTYTIFNNGDTTAENVNLESVFPAQAFSFMDKEAKLNEGVSNWDLGDIEAGGTREFKLHTKISDLFGKDRRSSLPLTAKVWSDQPDGNELDNEDSILLFVGKDRDDKESLSKTFPAKFEIEKSADRSEVKAGETVNYTVTLYNKGGPLFDSLLVDILVDENGKTISEQTWPLEEIKNGEKINITYSIILPENMPNGTYTNKAQLLGTHQSNKEKNRTRYGSQIAEHALKVNNLPEGEVLGISTDSAPTCSPYLNSYLIHNDHNDAVQVIRLQKFLQAHTNIPLIVNGVFDNPTKQAVKAFQEQHMSEILAPWGLSEGTGHVYYTTQKKINEVACGNSVLFPLTTAQKNEMLSFRQTENHSSPDNDRVGFNYHLPVAPVKKETDSLMSTSINTTPTVNIDDLFQNQNEPKASSTYSRVENWIKLFKNTLTASR